uniref:Methyl-CpG-binding domain protein 2-like n=1 Tax=Sinocyclocheilus rhinocerous TaxID=307959 RepID=A0A673IAM1_9TELE
MERKKTDCPALPPGWKKEEVIRKSGLSAGKSDVYYYSPTGKKFRSKPQLSRYLGNSVDLGCFDFRTGKIMPSKMQKNKQRLRSDNLSLSKVLNATHLTGHFILQFNDSKCDVDLQSSLFWEKRLKGLRSSDVSEEALRTMDLPRGLQSMGPDLTDETLLSAIASALHMSSAPITGQTSSAAEKNPSIWLNTSQPLCKAFTVTDDDIREQELKVHQARRSLEDALMADGLARAAESSRDMEDSAA